MTIAPRVYFFCGNEPGNLQEDVIALAEGLLELGIPFYSNCDYWQQSLEPDDYLLRHNSEVRHEDCDIVVLSYTWPLWVRMGTFDLFQKQLPEGLFRRGRKYITIFMDNHDGYRTVSWEPEYRQFDLILRSKLNRRAWHPENIRPWAYGLTNRVTEATAGAPPFASRRRVILVNFGASHPYPHGARELSRTRFEPTIEKYISIDRTMDDLSEEPSDQYEALMWRQTGGRFNRRYYERLKQSQAVACFCGDVIPPMPFRGPERYLVGGNRAKLRRAFFEMLSLIDPRPPRAVGCDSFRFWEALSAGCAAINIDLEHYGVKLPIMPENGRHYLGLNFARVKQFIEQLREQPELLEGLAREGKRWAEMHYSPRAAAQRLLRLCGHDAPSRVDHLRPVGEQVEMSAPG
jgi:hypothetical protein